MVERMERHDEGESVSVHPAHSQGHTCPAQETDKVKIVDVVKDWRGVLDVAYTSPDTACALAAVTPKVLGVALGLLLLSFVTTHLLPGGFIWGIFAAVSVMMTGFFWLCASNALKLHRVPEKTRNELRRGVLLLIGVFLLSIVSIIYFFALGLKLI